LEYVSANGDTTAVAVLHEYVHNEGSGWDYTLAFLKRVVDEARARQSSTAPDGTTPPAEAESTPRRAGFTPLMGPRGQRTAQLHRALARRTGDAAFDPEPFTDADIAALRKKLQNEVQATIDLLASRLVTLPDAIRGDAQRLLDSSDALRALAAEVVPD